MAHTPKEGKWTVAVEKQTSKVPSIVYLGAAAAALLTSVTLKCAHKNHTALMIGQLICPLMIMGLYNKVVKTEGHD